MSKKQFTVTSALPYANGPLHIVGKQLYMDKKDDNMKKLISEIAKYLKVINR